MVGGGYKFVESLCMRYNYAYTLVITILLNVYCTYIRVITLPKRF